MNSCHSLPLKSATVMLREATKKIIFFAFAMVGDGVELAKIGT